VSHDAIATAARRAGARLFSALLAVATLAAPVTAQSRVDAARGLLVAWHEEPVRIDRARTLLEAAAAADPSVDTFVELSEVWFLTGDFRARSDAERLAAYAEGARAAQRAIADAPQNERAHLLLAFNTGRSAEIAGVMRAIAQVNTIRRESETVLRLNPSNVDGLILAGGLAAGLPVMMGGDRAKAESLFARALGLDPHQTGGRIELARLYLAQRRWSDAARELQAVMDDTAPSDRPRWAMSDLPRARELLFELRARGRVPGIPPQSP
jgi:tetratricopeptide (TPR) repeat protein